MKQRIGLVLFAPAGIGACVAGWAVGICLDEECIVVAVALDADHMQVVAACLALRPKALARTAIEGDKTSLLRLPERFLVHVAKHQHGLCLCILDNGRHQAATLWEVYL